MRRINTRTLVALFILVLGTCAASGTAAVLASRSTADWLKPGTVSTATMAVKITGSATRSVKVATVAAVAPQITATPYIKFSMTGQFLVDKAGRPLGGNAPFLNYSPSFYTGKPCPRMDKWSVDKIQVDKYTTLEKLRDRCVLQNALDDYMEIAWADDWYLTVDQYKAKYDNFKSDPLMMARNSPFAIELTFRDEDWKNGWVGQCDKPLYRLIVPDTFGQAESEGTIVYIKFVRVAKDLQPYRCKGISIKDGHTEDIPPVTAQSLASKKAIQMDYVQMAWSKKLNRWQVLSYIGADYLDSKTLKQVYQKAATKP
jgi:hypothetical protein